MDGTNSGFISMKEVLKLTGISRPTADRLRRRGQFPQSFELTPHGKIGFLLSEVIEWIATRPRRTLRPLA